MDPGREVVMVVKMTMTAVATSLTQHGLWAHICPFAEALFEVLGRGFRLDSAKFVLLHVMVPPAALLVPCWFQLPK